MHKNYLRSIPAVASKGSSTFTLRTNHFVNNIQKPAVIPITIADQGRTTSAPEQIDTCAVRRSVPKLRKTKLEASNNWKGRYLKMTV